MKTSVLLVMVSCCAAGALATDAKRTEPRPIETPSPDYPVELTDTGISGSAVVVARVNADGTVDDVSIRSADHDAFATAAMTAFRAWRFEPAIRDDVATNAWVAIPFQFPAPVEQQVNARFNRKVYQPLAEEPLSPEEFGREPKPRKRIHAPYPKELLRSRLTGTVTIDFIIAPDGTTLNPQIRGRPWKGFVLPALGAVVAATFEPPVKEGRGVYVTATTTLRFAPPPQAYIPMSTPSLGSTGIGNVRSSAAGGTSSSGSVCP